jgi:hypothetical protein
MSATYFLSTFSETCLIASTIIFAKWSSATLMLLLEIEVIATSRRVFSSSKATGMAILSRFRLSLAFL